MSKQLHTNMHSNKSLLIITHETESCFSILFRFLLKYKIPIYKNIETNKIKNQFNRSHSVVNDEMMMKQMIFIRNVL